MTLRNRVLSFFVPILWILFCRHADDHVRSLALAVAQEVDMYSSDLGPDQISITPENISNFAANLEKANPADANQDSAKIELWKNKLSNLNVLRQALQNEIPDFYNEHTEMWSQLRSARIVFYQIRERKQHFEPPFSWITKAGKKYIDDWDGNSLTKIIFDILYNDKANERRTNSKELINRSARPAKILIGFLNSLSWHAFIAYHNLSHRLVRYQALVDSGENFRDEDFGTLQDNIQDVNFIFDSISRDLISLMPQHENDSFIAKARGPMEFLPYNFSTEYRIATQVESLNTIIKKRFDYFDYVLRLKASGVTMEPRYPLKIKLLSPDKLPKKNLKKAQNTSGSVAKIERPHPERKLLTAEELSKKKLKKIQNTDANEEEENLKAAVTLPPFVIKAKKKKFQKTDKKLKQHAKGKMIVDLYKSVKNESKDVKESSFIGHDHEHNRSTLFPQQQQHSGLSPSKWPNRDFDFSSPKSRLSSPSIPPLRSSSSSLLNKILYSMISGIIAGSIGVGLFGIHHYYSHNKSGLRDGNNNSAAAFSQNQSGNRVFIGQLVISLLIAFVLFVWYSRANKLANGYSLNKVRDRRRHENQNHDAPKWRN